MLEIPAAVDWSFLTNSQRDITLVGAGVLTSLLLIVGWANFRPWWEARKMRMEKELSDRKRMAGTMVQVLRDEVRNGEMAVEDAVVWYNRFASLLPLKEMMKDSSYLTLKEFLSEKHQKKEEPTVVVVQKTGALARMSARLKPSAA